MKPTRLRLPILLGLMLAAVGLPKEAAAQCVDCSLCESGGQLGNKAPLGDGTSIHEIREGSHSSCYTTGGCSTNHPPTCSDMDDEQVASLIEQVKRAAVAGNIDEALQIGKPGRITFVYVAERHAIQGLGCKDQVIAHVPIRHALVDKDL